MNIKVQSRIIMRIMDCGLRINNVSRILSKDENQNLDHKQQWLTPIFVSFQIRSSQDPIYTMLLKLQASQHVMACVVYILTFLIARQSTTVYLLPQGLEVIQMFPIWLPY